MKKLTIGNSVIFLEDYDLTSYLKYLASTNNEEEFILYVGSRFKGIVEISRFVKEIGGKVLKFDLNDKQSTGLHFFKRKHIIFMANLIDGFSTQDINSFLKIAKSVNSRLTILRTIEDELCNEFRVKLPADFTENKVEANLSYFYRVDGRPYVDQIYNYA